MTRTLHSTSEFNFWFNSYFDSPNAIKAACLVDWYSFCVSSCGVVLFFGIPTDNTLQAHENEWDLSRWHVLKERFDYCQTRPRLKLTKLTEIWSVVRCRGMLLCVMCFDKRGRKINLWLCGRYNGCTSVAETMPCIFLSIFNQRSITKKKVRTREEINCLLGCYWENSKQLIPTLLPAK